MDFILSVIGYWGPTILLFSTIIGLYIFNSSIIKYYCIFQTLNSMLNSIIKLIIKQPRPKNQKHIYNFEKKSKLKVMSGQEYGMPSGHAQSSLYSVMTNYYFTNCYFTFFSILVSCITLYQRYKYRNHTKEQLLMGSLTGMGIFYGGLKLMSYF